MNKENLRMQMLAGVITEDQYKDKLNEYDNSSTTSPKVFILDVKDNKIIPSDMGEVNKVSNLTYDMGGGETSYYDEYNVVIVDNMDENEVLEGLPSSSNAEKKLYIKFNLNSSINLPKANKIKIAQLVYHLSNLESFAQTVNNSLKDGGKIEFFSDKMFKKDKQFLDILINQYGFQLPDDITIQQLPKYKSETLTLQKGKPFITPPQVLNFKLKNTITGDEGILTYEKQKTGRWLETVSGGLDPKDFYNKNGKPKEWNGPNINYPLPPLGDLYTRNKDFSRYEEYVSDYPSRVKYLFIEKI
jgi:hypothetical protein